MNGQFDIRKTMVPSSGTVDNAIVLIAAVSIIGILLLAFLFLMKAFAMAIQRTD